MINKEQYRILTINSGSSSIKFSLYEMEQVEVLIMVGEIKSIGQSDSIFHAKNAGVEDLIEKRINIPSHDEALQMLFNWLKSKAYDHNLDAIGHRMVHGGTKYKMPQLITEELIAELRRLNPFAPEHLPHEINTVETACKLYPSLKQVACFDTSFHRDMPQVARLYALPRYLLNEGVLRYGFHGLSYEYIVNELSKVADREVADGRIIVAHLGHGASMAAIYNGQGVDTTMGFTPTGGLAMSTRSGDLDPGVIHYLLVQKGLNADKVNDLVNQEAGLLGVSGSSADMKDLLGKEKKDPWAREAVELFCYQAKKFLGGLVAVLGGLDTLIFTGGIGENSPIIRLRICDGLGFLGIHLDPEHNRTNAPVISSDDSPCTVRVIRTNEELMIARHTYNLFCKNEQTIR